MARQIVSMKLGMFIALAMTLLSSYSATAKEGPAIDLSKGTIAIAGRALADLDMDAVTDLFGRPDAVIPPTGAEGQPTTGSDAERRHGKRIVYATRGIMFELKPPETDPHERCQLLDIFLSSQDHLGISYSAFQGTINGDISQDIKMKRMLELFGKDGKDVVDMTGLDIFGDKKSSPGYMWVTGKDARFTATFFYNKATLFIDRISVLIQ